MDVIFFLVLPVLPSSSSNFLEPLKVYRAMILRVPKAKNPIATEIKSLPKPSSSFPSSSSSSAYFFVVNVYLLFNKFSKIRTFILHKSDFQEYQRLIVQLTNLFSDLLGKDCFGKRICTLQPLTGFRFRVCFS